MSYNTRRQNFGTPQQSSNVGQRRPVTNNFVSGGQLSGNQQKPQVQQQQARTPQQQQQSSGINFRQQQQQQQQQNVQQQNVASTPQQQRAPQTPVKQEIKVQPPKAVSTPAPAPSAPVVPGANPPPPEQEDDMDTGAGGEKKKFWAKKKGTKISRSEKIRRRNLRLSKILQPKNAVMILNELVKGCEYKTEEIPVKTDGNMFKGTVSFDGQEFIGAGRTKSGAKNAAAETALKHIIKNKKVPTVKKEETDGDVDEDGDEKMETGDDEASQVMPWSHIASFAMYKLFSMWGEDPNLVNRVTPQEVQAQTSGGAAAAASSVKSEKAPAQQKPSKKMPENPDKMNPLQLMHQMCPNAVWDEIGKSGNPPNLVFTYGVTIDDKQFQGTGASKKIAKKLAAFAACHELLGVLYPPDVWAPLY